MGIRTLESLSKFMDLFLFYQKYGQENRLTPFYSADKKENRQNVYLEL